MTFFRRIAIAPACRTAACKRMGIPGLILRESTDLLKLLAQHGTLERSFAELNIWISQT